MLWIKSLHIISLVAWFAGLFYLPRLYVYHAMYAADVSRHEVFKVMEYKLYKYIMTPAAIVTLGSGIWLLYDYAWELYAKSGWLHAKLGIVFILVAYHVYCGILLQDFKNNENKYSHKFYRWFNEVPSILLVAGVIMVVVKPLL